MKINFNKCLKKRYVHVTLKRTDITVSVTTVGYEVEGLAKNVTKRYYRVEDVENYRN